ncbi:MAG: SGNH/GDSL hydrolase family protein [Actinomycetota bacterium]|nr:SGNH/GDSL hydrolase family protein [Actinomycetota bacterium]
MGKRFRRVVVVATVTALAWAGFAVPMTASIASAAQVRAPSLPPSRPSSPPGPPYYLSLGDSLAQGVQPTATGQSVETDQGYANDLYDLYRFAYPGLHLEKLGCPGETTETMVHGGICSYPEGSQLAAAVAFLRTHRVAFVTLDIGANNVDDCVTGTAINLGCVESGIGAVVSDLPVVLSALRAAAPGVPIYGMNYYDPFLAAWLEGSTGRIVATASLALANTFNGDLGAVYAQFGVPVANVAGLFQTDDMNEVPVIDEPVDVSTLCSLTWMCVPPPVGPNIHANAAGYWVIAAAFAAKLGFPGFAGVW